jgi:hypothetical protein
MKKLLLLCFLSTTLIGCYQTPDTSSLSSDFVVATNRDLRVNFGDFTTYHISDTIPRITDSPTDTIIVGPEALEIVNKIKENLDARGYQFVERNQNPDLAVIPAVIRVTTVGTVCSGWWYGYPGYWPPGYWGSWGGYYYPYCGFYSYDTGSVNIDLMDLLNSDAGNNISATWTAVLFGSLNSSDAVNLDRALTGIDQAFEQSPYITSQ